MSESQHTLDELQRWMQAVVTHPRGVAAGIESEAAREQISVLAPVVHVRRRATVVAWSADRTPLHGVK